MIVFFEANFIQVIALTLLAGTLIFIRLSDWKAKNSGLITNRLGVNGYVGLACAITGWRWQPVSLLSVLRHTYWANTRERDAEQAHTV